MSILASDVINTAKGLIAEDNPKFFTEPFMIQGLNSAIVYGYNAVSSPEYRFLKKGTITISSTDVTNKKRDYALPSRTYYVSNYVLRPQNIDYRPKYVDGVNDRWLSEELDYYIDGTNFILTFDPEAPATITIWHKALPARITKATDTITEFPDVFFNFFVEYLVWYCKRREMDGDTVPKGMVVEELNLAIAMLNEISGKPRGFEPNWDAVEDWDP